MRTPRHTHMPSGPRVPWTCRFSAGGKVWGYLESWYNEGGSRGPVSRWRRPLHLPPCLRGPAVAPCRTQGLKRSPLVLGAPFHCLAKRSAVSPQAEDLLAQGTGPGGRHLFACKKQAGCQDCWLLGVPMAPSPGEVIPSKDALARRGSPPAPTPLSELLVMRPHRNSIVIWERGGEASVSQRNEK